jgi:hypothetical protein
MLRLWARVARRPIDSIAILGALAASLVIILNALVLQSGSSPAPFLVNAPAQPTAADHRTSVRRSSLHWAGPPLAPQELAAARNDPIGQLIGLSSRIMAVQRSLSDYGYGQLRPTGVLDQPTSVAIEKFQREHGLPINGRISERLMNELAAMVGHPLQ